MQFTFSSVYIAAFLLSLGLLACESSTLNTEPNIAPPLVALHYDGPVNTAPITSGGTYEAAIRFPASELAAYADKPLTGVYFYLLEKPSSSTVKIYQGSLGNRPDELVYSAATSSETAPQSWNEHQLSNPVLIDANRDLWISIKYAIPNPGRVIGCDQGPAHPDGAWLYQSSDDEFRTFPDRSNGEADINWSIRGVVDPS